MMNSTDRGVSPVVAVILLVAVTVTLSAVIGGFALELGQSTTSGSASQQSVGVSTSQSNGTFTATVVTGSADKAKLLVNGSEVDNITNPSAGDALTANVSNGDDVTIVTVTDGESSVVTSQTTTQTTSSTSQNTLTAANDLIAHYKFENGSGSTAYDAQDTYNGTIHGASWTSSAKVGDYALSFPGSSDRVNLTDESAFETAPLTISAWFKAPSPQDSGWEVIFSKSYWNNNNGFSFHINGGGNLTYNEPGVGATTTGTLSADEWYHGVVVINSTNATLYLNGTRVTTGESSLTGTTKPAYIGIRTTNDGTSLKDPFEGEIDDVRVYNETLNDSEVKDIYDATK